MPSFLSSEASPLSGDVRQALEDLETASQTSPKQRQGNLAEIVKVLTTDAYEHGLPADLLERLIDIITRPHLLDQATATALVKNMYPSSKVSSSVVSKIVASLGPSKLKPTPATQALLVRWLILVYDILGDGSHLVRCYAVLFNHLDMMSLRRPLCHLLALLTRRRHVKSFRIQALMALAQEVGDGDKELLGLIRVYKNYYPDMMTADNGRSIFFKTPDREWTGRLGLIQEANAGVDRGAGTTDHTFRVVRKGAKRSRVDVLPEVQTSRVNERSTTLEEVRDVSDFVDKFEKLETPNQAISMLSDPLAQKYLLFHPSDANKRRIEHWLEAFFAEILDSLHQMDDDARERLGIVLEAVSAYTELAKVLPTPAERFLRAYVQVWNGQDPDTLLPLLARLPMMSPSVLLHDYHLPLETAILTQDVQSKSILLDHYTALLRHWTCWILAAGSQLQEGKDLSSSNWTMDLFAEVISHAEFLAFSMLETPNSPRFPVDTAVLKFYKSLARIFAHSPRNTPIRLKVPIAPAIYNLVFTETATSISLLCSVLADYKTTFEALITTFPQDEHHKLAPYSPETVSKFNGIVMDVCNLLWRSRALNSSDPNAKGCLISSSVQASLAKYLHDLTQGLTLSSSFGLPFHPAFSSISASYVRTAEDEVDIALGERLGAPVTQKRLTAIGRSGGLDLSWQDYRLNMIEWMESLGVKGIGELMRRTMKLLREGKSAA